MAALTCLLFLLVLPGVLLQQAEKVFLKHENAHSVLSRAKRANTPFEEFKKGNLERECYEERCSYEEAREVFEDQDKTREFWNKYFDDSPCGFEACDRMDHDGSKLRCYDGDQCVPNPCFSGGSCKDGIGEYTCLCSAGYEGKNCEREKLQLCTLNNGDCEQYCRVEDMKVVCSCTTGYVLGEDGKSCIPTDKYPCGRRQMFRKKRSATNNKEFIAQNISDVQDKNSTAGNEDSLLSRNISLLQTNENEESDPNTRIVGGTDCKPGECPWQALLVSEENEGFCGGTILSKEFILTAAHCMNQTKYFKVVVGELNTKKSEGTESTHKVDKIIIHPRFVKATYDFDMAVVKLKEAINFTQYIIPACIPEPDFADQVLMNEPEAMVSGFGRLHERGLQASKLQMLHVPYISRHRCKESSTFAITDNMFCAGFDVEVKDACQGDSGGPHVTAFRDTYFVTGIVSWGEGCAQKGKFGVYTKVSKLHKWLRGVLKRHQS